MWYYSYITIGYIGYSPYIFWVWITTTLIFYVNLAFIQKKKLCHENKINGKCFLMQHEKHATCKNDKIWDLYN